MKIKKLLIPFMIVLLAVSVYSILDIDLFLPADQYYIIKYGAVDSGNNSYSANATPDTLAGIQNISLWTNISGTWKLNWTNDTAAEYAQKVNRTFKITDTSIFQQDLPDGLRFNWGVEVCENKTSFNQSVSLNTEEFGIVFDNNTGCTGICNSTVIIRGGTGFLTNAPVVSIDSAWNMTSFKNITSGCKLNDSVTGYFYCNETQTKWDGDFWNNSRMADTVIRIEYTTTSCRFSENRSVLVEDAPNVNIPAPLTGAIQNTSNILFNVSVNGDDDQYGCHVYSNSSGTWKQMSGSFDPQNSTLHYTTKVFAEKNGINWNIRCEENQDSNVYGWNESNRTITIDKTAPVISVTSPEDNASIRNLSDEYTVRINVTVTDLNPNRCSLVVNGTTNVSKDYTSGLPLDLKFNASGTFYVWSVNCTDDVRLFDKVNASINLDYIIPKVTSNVNYSTAGSCDRFTVEFRVNENVNATFTYGLTSQAATFTEKKTAFRSNQTFNLTFNTSYETTFYTNISVCDRAGNCNNTHLEMQIDSPITVCTGWSLWGIYDNIINMSTLFSQSNADFVYSWFENNQSWLSISDASSSAKATVLRIGDVAQVYSSTDETWFRNKSGLPGYHYNVTTVHNFVPIYYSTIIGNQSYVQFRNSTFGNATDIASSYGVGGTRFQIEFYNVYNNTAQEWISSIQTWSRNNNTAFGAIKKIGVEVLHITTAVNITANITSNGQVFANWSG